MKKIKDNYSKSWALDDLTEKEKAIGVGCEPGKKYTGDVGAPEEIPFCPHCGSTILEKKRCKHFLFYYDSKNGEYKNINQIFQSYIKRDKTLGFPVDEFPVPKDIADKIPQLFLAEITDESGSHGIICGYGDEKFIRQIKVTKNWSNKYY